MPDTPNRAAPTQGSVPIAHLALLLGSPKNLPDLTSSLRYRGLAVVGAVRFSATPDLEELMDCLSDIYQTALSPLDIQKVHILQFPGADVDLDDLVLAIHKDYGEVEVHRVPVKTEAGARAYFEEAHSLVPEDPEDIDAGEEYVKGLIADPGFQTILRTEAERLRAERGIPQFPEPDPFSLTSESESGDGAQDTSGGLERVEPKTLSEAKVYLEGRNDTLSKEVDRLSRENRELSGDVARLEDRVTGLLRVLDRVSHALVK
jgi:hypothetical protein